MWNRLKVSVIKELLLFWHDPQSRRTLFALPLVQVLVFGFAGTLDVQNVRIAVLNQDSGYWSGELVSRVAAASFTSDVHYVGSMQQLREQLEMREVLLALVVPADFSRRVVDRSGAQLQLLSDGRRANAAQVATGYVSHIVSTLNQDLSADSAAATPGAALANWFNPNLDYGWFMVPNLVAILAMMMAMMMTGLSIARERELGTFDQLLVSPSTAIEIIVSKTVPGILTGTFVGCVVVVVASWGFSVPFRGNLVLVLLTLLPFLLSMSGLGLVLSAVSNTQQQAMLGMFFALMPFMLLSGFATPVDNMPDWLQVVAELNPLKHYLVIIQGSFLKAMPAADVWRNTWPMLLIAGASLTIATQVVRRRLH